MPPGHNLKPLLWGLWKSVLLKNIFSIWKCTTLNKMAISRFWNDVFEGMMGVGGGLVAIQSLSTVKKGTNPLNFQSNETFLKFLRQRLLSKPYMPPGHNLKPLPWGLWGSVLLKNIFSIWKSTTLNKMTISKFWLDVFGGMMGGVAGCPPITCDY